MTIASPSAPCTADDSPSANRLWRWAWVLLLVAIALLLFARGITRIDEGRYAETAREMIEDGGDAWQMRLMGVRYYEKPPLLYWMSAFAMDLAGKTQGVARLPLLLSIVFTIGLCFRWARQEWGGGTARAVRAVLLSCMGMIVAMSILLTDPLLVLFFTATCLFLFESHRADRKNHHGRWLLAAAAAAWGGVLTKGFLAIVLPGAILVGWLLWERRLRDLWRWSLLPIGLLFAGSLALILWKIEQHNPGFNFHFIVQEHFQRFTGTRAIQGHPEPFWYYLPLILAMLCPWTFFLPRAIREMRSRQDLKQDSFSRFLVVWACAVFLFFSVSSGKLMSYIMPMVPPMALLLARRGLVPARRETDAADRRLWNLGAFLPFLATVGMLIFWSLARFGLANADMGPPTWLVFLPAAAGVLLSFWVWRRGYWKTLPGLLLVTASAYLAFACLISSLAGPAFLVGFRDHRTFFGDVAAQVQPENELILCREHIPALAFYTDRVPWLYRVDNELVTGMEMEPDLQGVFQSSGQLDAVMARSPYQTYYGVLRRKDQQRLMMQGLRFYPEIYAEDQKLILLRLMPPL